MSQQRDYLVELGYYEEGGTYWGYANLRQVVGASGSGALLKGESGARLWKAVLEGAWLTDRTDEELMELVEQQFSGALNKLFTEIPELVERLEDRLDRLKEL